ncbi:MAG TPA: hypothetical protein PK976_08025, partial [Bacteroidales bacterium]|nr:hypothetical protein [Bacteroidales bacterium]
LLSKQVTGKSGGDFGMLDASGMGNYFDTRFCKLRWKIAICIPIACGIFHGYGSEKHGGEKTALLKITFCYF